MSSQVMIATNKIHMENTEEVEHFDFKKILYCQREYFESDATKSIEFRLAQLKKLKKLIRQHEDIILEALKQDLGRHPMESYISEIMLLINEINHCIKKLKSWAKPKSVENNFYLYPAESKIYYDPFGVCLIISPWNYPFFLTIRPLIGAISAGNCVTLKCSEYASYTSRVIVELINQHFPQEYLYAINCGPKSTELLIQAGYDFILYTGNAQTGKNIMKLASETLTPVVLELGGKCPVIVDETANIHLAAKRIVWAKYINSGQTCIAPDYIYVHVSRKNELIQALQNQIIKYYSQDPITCTDYGKIINRKHFMRLSNLLNCGRVIFGGNVDESQFKIEPTLMEIDSHDEEIMQEEIFGPILPILSFKDLDILISSMKKLPKPLSLYYFSKNKVSINKVNKALAFGGGCINDCMMQITNIHLPFGGIGASGFGSYGGEQGFRTFSHAKSIVERKRVMLVDFLGITPLFTLSKFKLFRFFAKLIGY